MAKKDVNKMQEDIEKLKQKAIKDVDKEIKQSIIDKTHEYKISLYDEIKDNIKIQTQQMLKKEEKKLLRRKNITIIKNYIIIVILLTIIMFLLYCLYDAKYFTNIINNDSVESSNVLDKNLANNNEKTLEWYIENYSYLLDHSNLKLDTNLIDSYYLYSDTHELETVKKSYLLNMAYQNLDENLITQNNNKISIKGEDLEESFKNIFDFDYIAQDFKYSCMIFNYNSNKDLYTANVNECTDQSKEIVEQITDISEDDNYLYINTIATIYDNNEQAFYSFTDLYNPLILDVKKSDFSKFNNKFNEYQYVYHKLDNHLFLDTIKKIS